MNTLIFRINNGFVDVSFQGRFKGINWGAIINSQSVIFHKKELITKICWDIPCGLVGSKLFGRSGWDPGIPPGGCEGTRHRYRLEHVLGKTQTVSQKKNTKTTVNKLTVPDLAFGARGVARLDIVVTWKAAGGERDGEGTERQKYIFKKNKFLLNGRVLNRRTQLRTHRWTQCGWRMEDEAGRKFANTV